MRNVIKFRELRVLKAHAQRAIDLIQDEDSTYNDIIDGTTIVFEVVALCADFIIKAGERWNDSSLIEMGNLLQELVFIMTGIESEED